MGESERRDDLVDRCIAWWDNYPLSSRDTLPMFLKVEIARAESRARDEVAQECERWAEYVQSPMAREVWRYAATVARSLKRPAPQSPSDKPAADLTVLDIARSLTFDKQPEQSDRPEARQTPDSSTVQVAPVPQPGDHGIGRSPDPVGAPPAPAPAALSDAEAYERVAELIRQHGDTLDVPCTDYEVADALDAHAAKLRAQAEPVDVFEAMAHELDQDVGLPRQEYPALYGDIAKTARSWFGPALDALREIDSGLESAGRKAAIANRALAALDQRLAAENTGARPAPDQGATRWQRAARNEDDR